MEDGRWKYMTAFALLFTLAAIGIAETAYLIRKRIESEKPMCPIGGGCTIVLGSRYNKTLGVHNDLLGLLFYFGMGLATSLLVIGALPFDWQIVLSDLMILMVAAALFMSAYFFYLQWRVIKAWCFWCLMSALTIVCMTIILTGHR